MLFSLGDFAGAIPNLEHVVRTTPSLTTTALPVCWRMRTLETGQLDRAAPYFAEATQFSTKPETLYNYANFLRLQNRRDEAREWTRSCWPKSERCRVICKSRTAMVPQGKTLLKELSVA